MSTLLPAIRYLPCNGLNASQRLHSPFSRCYEDIEAAHRVAESEHLSHVAHVRNYAAQDPHLVELEVTHVIKPMTRADVGRDDDYSEWLQDEGFGSLSIVEPATPAGDQTMHPPGTVVIREGLRDEATAARRAGRAWEESLRELGDDATVAGHLRGGRVHDFVKVRRRYLIEEGG